MRILTITSWIAVLTVMFFIAWKLTDRFDPAHVYPRPEPTRYTEAAFKALQYENAMNKANRVKAERFIRSLADGNL